MSAIPPLSIRRLSKTGLAKFREEFTSWNRSRARVAARTYTIEDFADPAHFAIRGEHDEALESQWSYRWLADDREGVLTFDVGASFARRADACEEIYHRALVERWIGTLRPVLGVAAELVFARHRTTLATDWTIDEASRLWERFEERARDFLVCPLAEVVDDYLRCHAGPTKRAPANNNGRGGRC